MVRGKAFEFSRVPRVVLGRGEVRRVGELAAGFGRRAMVVYNGGGVGERIAEVLRAAGVESVVQRQRGDITGHTCLQGACDYVHGVLPSLMRDIHALSTV